jgi:hypothetical protein
MHGTINIKYSDTTLSTYMCMNAGCRLIFPRLHNTHIPLREGVSSSLSEFLLWIHKNNWCVDAKKTLDFTNVFTTIKKSVNSAIGRSSAHAQQSMLCLVPLFISGYVPCWHLYLIYKSWQLACVDEVVHPEDEFIGTETSSLLVSKIPELPGAESLRRDWLSALRFPVIRIQLHVNPMTASYHVLSCFLINPIKPPAY